MNTTNPAPWRGLAAIGAAFSIIAPTVATAQSALDYKDPANWASTARAEGAAAAVAPGASPRRALRRVDVFYVHPTTDFSHDHAIGEVSDPKLQAWTDGSVVARQAGAFNRCCRIYAPRYRQAAAGPGDPAARQAAIDFAYKDVLAAFDDYLAHDNGGRPFILVGHSQGAYHVRKLLEDRIDGTPLQKRLVAAYVVGMGLTEGDFGRTFKSVKICDTPRQTGCVVQWNSMLPTGDRADFAGFSQKSYIQRWGDNAGKALLCVNPLTFDRSRPAAPSTAAKGAVPGAPDASPMQAIVPHAVSARCEDGVLVVEPSAALSLKPLTASSPHMNGSMHMHDVGLFYEDVRENADLRAQAFLRRKSQPGH